MSEITPSKKSPSVFNALKLLPLQPRLHLREQKELTRGLTRGIWGMGDQLNVICFQVVQSAGGGVGTCVVVVGQQAAGAVV